MLSLMFLRVSDRVGAVSLAVCAEVLPNVLEATSTRCVSGHVEYFLGQSSFQESHWLELAK